MSDSKYTTTVRLSLDLYEWLRDAAKAEERSQSAIMSRALKAERERLERAAR